MSRLAATCTLGVLTAAVTPAQDFVNFEGPQTHPIRISADGSRLFTVLTPDARLCVWNLATPDRPILIDEIPVGQEPISVTQRTDDELWVVNYLSDSISIVSLSAGRVVDTLRVKDEPADVAFAAGKAFVTAAASDAVHVFDAVTRAPLAVIDIDGKDPRALGVSPDESTVYALIQRSGNRTATLPKGLAPPQPPPTNPALPAAPEVALIVSVDDPLYGPQLGFSLEDYDLARIDTASLAVSGYTPGIGTINQDLVVDPVTGDVYVTGLHARNLVRYEPTVRGHAVDSYLARVVAGAGPIAQVDLNAAVSYATLPDAAASSIALSEPTGLALDTTAGLVYVAAQGTDRIGVVATGGGIVARIEVGETPGALVDSKTKRGPRGLALNTDTDRLYVLNRISQTVSVIDTVGRVVLEEFPNGSHDPTPATLKQGRGFHYDAKLSGNGTFSCNACHWDTEMDGLAWDLGNPGGDLEFPPTHPDPVIDAVLQTMSFHPMKGPMVTQTLRGLAGTGPLHWRGDRPTFQDFNPAFDGLMGGPQLAPGDMDLYAEFGMTIANVPNPNIPLDGQYTAEQASGEDVFLNNTVEEIIPGKTTCNACHTVPMGTTGQVLPSPKGPIKPAPLRSLYRRLGMNLQPTGIHKSGFGVPHDGHTTLENHISADTFMVPDGKHDDLMAFLLAFDTGTPPATGHEVRLASSTLGSPEVTTDLSILESLAQAGTIDLVAKGDLLGERHGLVYDGAADLYLADTTLLGPYTRTDLENLAQTSDADLVLVGVPTGSGTRIGVDRDLDGVLDGDAGGVPHGSATPSCGLTPTIAINSEPYVGNENFAFLGETVADADGFLVLGSPAIVQPVLGIDLLATPVVVISVKAEADGNVAVSTPIGATVVAGSSVVAQFVWVDPCGPQGFTASAALQIQALP